MTFVRAQLTSEGMVIQSDWLVTDPRRTRPPSFSDGIVKTLVLNDKVCISFAGDVEACLDAIRELRTLSKGRHHRSGLVEILRAASGDGARCEFIAAFLRPAELFEIKSGLAARQGAGWVGCHDAFEVYQTEYYAQMQQGGHQIGFVAQRMAFRAVIQADLANVGLLAVGVVSGSHGFVYSDSFIASPGFSLRAIPTHTDIVIDWGSEQDGAYACSIHGPKEPRPTVGVYFPHGRVGLVSAPLDRVGNVQFGNCTEDEFIARAWTDLRVDLRPGIVRFEERSEG